MHFDPDAGVFALSNWHKIQLCHKFSAVIFTCLTPLSQLWLHGLHGLMKQYVSNAAMKMGKRHFYSDHSSGKYPKRKICFIV